MSLSPEPCQGCSLSAILCKADGCFMLQDAFVALAYGPQKDGVCTLSHAHALHALALEGMKVGTSYETRLCHHVTRDGQAP